MITVRYFAAAADAAGCDSEQFEASTLGELLTAARAGRSAHFGQVLGRCSVLVAGQFTDDPATALVDGSQVDVLPPFAGG